MCWVADVLPPAMRAAHLLERSALGGCSRGESQPFRIVHIEVSNCNKSGGVHRVRVEFLLESEDRCNISSIWWAVPQAEQHRPTVAVNDMPTALIGRRIADIDNIRREALEYP